MPKAIEAAELPFAVAATREKFLKADRTARKIAGASWAKQPADTYQYVGWNGGTGGYRQTYAARWERASDRTAGVDPKRPDHKIGLSTELYHEPRQAYGFSLHATWKPKHEWGAFVNFRSFDGPTGFLESFSVTLFHPEFLPQAARPASALVLGHGRAQFATTRSDDRHYYKVAVFSRPLEPEEPLHRLQVDSIQRYWSSSTSFREAALEELDRLEENARRQIASGRAFTVETLGGPTGADVPLPVPNDQIPHAVKQAVLDEALAEIEVRRKLVQAHYRAMHAGVVAAFPELPEVVQPTQKE
jgi:hypothetical protein